MKFIVVILNYLRKSNTSIGRIIWITNSILLVFYINSFLYIILSPYGFLNQFIVASVAIFDVILPVLVFYYKFKPLTFLDKIPLICHTLFLIILALIYITSIKHIWIHKREYNKVI